MKLKKLLALILALMMVLSSVPLALAEGEETPATDVAPVEETTPVEEEEVPELVNDAPEQEEVPEQVNETPEQEEEVPELVNETPVEEPEEPELVESDVDYQVKLVFKYVAPGQTDKELLLQNGVMTEAQEASIAPAAWEGHKFTEWDYVPAGAPPETTGTKKGDLHKITFPDKGTIEITAVWEAETFDVLFKKGTADAGDYMPPDLDEIEYGTVLPAADVAVSDEGVEGYDYEKPIYKVNGEVIDITTYQIKAKTVITIEIPLKKVTVSFYLDADDKEAYDEQKIDYGTKASVPTVPTDEHRTFVEWQTNGAKFDFDTGIVADIKAYATWKAGQVTVTFDPNGGKVDGEATKTVTVDYNTPVGSNPVAVKEGQTFVSWQLNGEDFDVVNTKVTADITLVASYLTDTVTLTYKRTEFLGGNAEVWPKKGDVEVDFVEQPGEWGTAFTPFADVTREGFTLDGWTDGTMKDGKPVKFDFSAVKEDKDLYAIWKPVPVTITLVPGQSGAKFADGTQTGKTVPATITSHYGAILTFDMGAQGEDVEKFWELYDLDGFDFLYWYYKDVDRYGETVKVPFMPDDEIELTEDITLYVEWDAYYTVALYDGVDKDGKDVPLDYPALSNGKIRVYLEAKEPEEGHRENPWTTVEGFQELGKEIYKTLDSEDMTLLGAKYFADFLNGTTPFDLVKDKVSSNLTLKASRLDLVTVTFDYNFAETDVGSDQLGQKAHDPVKYPKGTTLAGIPNLRGNEKPEGEVVGWVGRFFLPELAKEHYTFDGYKKGTAVFGENDPINANIELVAQWIPTKWTVTLDLDGGKYDYDTEYSVVDGDTVILKGEPTKTDCLFSYWYTLDGDEEEAFVSGETQIFKDTTVYAKWETFAAKDKTATDPKKTPEKYFDSLKEALEDTAATDIIVLKDLTDLDTVDTNINVSGQIKSLDLNGKIVEIADAGIYGNNDVIIKNGTLRCIADYAQVAYVKIASGTFEDITLMGNEDSQFITGGNFRWTDDKDHPWVEYYVKDLNDRGYVVDGKKLHLKNGYYTPVTYKTLTISSDEEQLWEDTEIDVFEGEKTILPKEIDEAIKGATDKFDKWVIYDEESEEPVEFKFGSELTEDTVIDAVWIEKVKITFLVETWDRGPVIWYVDTYSDQLIEKPVEPTEDDYAEMTKSREEDVRAAWRVINSEGFLGWRYEDSGKNVAFGVDKAKNTTIYAARKNEVVFVGLGNEIVDILYLDDGETVNDKGGMPEAPVVEGYTFNYWLDGDDKYSPVFKPNEKIYNDHRVQATYATGNWAISSVEEWLSDGHSALPTDDLIFGGDQELTLRLNWEDEKYYLGFSVEAPDGIGDQRDNINEKEWLYRTDDEAWTSFNGIDRGDKGADRINGSQHLVMRMYKEVTWDMLKELVDTKTVKTWTLTFVPAEKKDDKSAYVTLKVTLDPKNVYLYRFMFEENAVPEHAVIQSRYKFPVTFEMDGGATIKPVEYEYGEDFYDRIAEFEITGIEGWKENWTIYQDPEASPQEREEARVKIAEIYKNVKKYSIFRTFGYYEHDGDEELSPIERGSFIIRGDKTVYALYNEVPLEITFYDQEGNEVGSTLIGLGDKMNELVVPEYIAGKYGTNDWYPIILDPEKKAEEAYDITSSEIIGDKYYDEKDPENSFIKVEDYSYSRMGRLNLIKGDKKGIEVVFLDEEWNWNEEIERSEHIYVPYEDTFYPFNESGDVTFGDIKVPDYEREGATFNGWLLLDDDHNIVWNDDGEYIWDEGDLKVFDFSKNASKSVKDKLTDWEGRKVLLFAPSVTYTNSGFATLYSANVEFDGLIHMIFKYNFKWYDRNADHFVVFRVGDTELARVNLKDAVQVEWGEDEEGDRYLVTCAVPIVNYTESINICVETADGEEWPTTTGKGVVVEGGYDYSLKTYAENKASSTNPKMAALAKALKDYGIATRLFAGKTDVKVSDLSDAVKNLKVEDMTVSETTVTPQDDRPEGITASQTVIFESDNTLQITFKGCDSTCTFVQDDRSVDIAPDADGNVVLKVKNIAPDKLDTAHTFKCTKGGKSFEITTSVLGYAKRSAEKGSEAMQNLAKALYLYAKAAIDYIK